MEVYRTEGYWSLAVVREFEEFGFTYTVELPDGRMKYMVVRHRDPLPWLCTMLFRPARPPPTCIHQFHGALRLRDAFATEHSALARVKLRQEEEDLRTPELPVIEEVPDEDM